MIKIFSGKCARAMVLLFLLCSCLTASASKINANEWQPEKTIALMIGVLSWQDKALSTFPTENRYDQKLYETLLERGIAKENIIFLKNEQTTLTNINEALQKLLAKSNEQSTFLFYYAGHGDRFEDGASCSFLNYDCDSANLATTSFTLPALADAIKSGFKGKKVILTADCCYSGYLNQVADELATAKIDTLVMSSASANNESTGEWTFTMSLNDIFSGSPFAKEVPASITAEFASDYIRYNMTYAEQQLANFYKTEGFPEGFVLAAKKPDYDTDKPNLGEFKTAIHEGEACKVRIIDQKGSSCKILFTGFDPAWEEWHDYANLKDIKLASFPLNSKVEVEWDKNWYKATVIKKDGLFHLVHYDDHDSTWDEWVASDRIRKK